MAITLLIVGCGPSAEESATMTAAAEPTPIPYDLSFTVTDQDGTTLLGASVEINGEAQITDESGETNWKNLPSGSATLSISAPGYFTSESTETLERGENQLSAVLELDSNGLLPVNACAASETLLYIDDFQSSIAQEWDSIEGGAPGWTVESDSENPDDLVVAAREGSSMAWLRGGEDYNFDNSVWRLRYKQVGNGSAHVNFRWLDNESSSQRYFLSLDPQEVRLVRWEPDNHVELG